MMKDARELPPGSQIEADLCIIGAGPAGLAMALRLDGAPFRVAVLESGGLGPEEASDALSAIASTSRFGDDLAVGAYRAIGGSATRWSIDNGRTKRNVRLTSMTEADFEERPWMEESGWPIPVEALDAYMDRAKAFFGLPQRSFLPQDWVDPETPALPIPEDRIRTRMFMFADADALLSERRRSIERSQNIVVYVHATAMSLERSPDGKTVSSVCVRAGRDHAFSVRADQVILSGGGLWVTQLLLASTAVAGEGLGGGGDHLGRHFNTHPFLYGGKFYPSDPALFAKTKLYDMRFVGETCVMAHLQLTDEALRREKALNMSMMIFPVEKEADAHRALSPRQKRGFDALIRMRFALRGQERVRFRHVVDLVCGLDGVLKRLVGAILWPKTHIGKGGWSRLDRLDRRYQAYDVFHLAEQGPHPDCRITLSDERDDLGQRRIHIDWRMRPEDSAAMRRAQEIFREELAKAGLGRFEIADHEGGPVFVHVSTNHFMGLTRMAANAQDGVVDPDCRVYGLDNLYIASSSVFPTGGFANPTLSIVALGYRVVDHVLAKMTRVHASNRASVAG